jgi:hypothetical protein
VRNKLGCGALALWIDGKPYPSETFDSYIIIKDEEDKIAFELEYETWKSDVKCLYLSC